MQTVKTTTNRALLISIGIVLGYLTLTPTPTQAQSNFSLSVFPPSAYLKIQPGTQASHAVTLTNNTTDPIVVVPKLFDSKPKEDTGYPELLPTFTFPYLLEPAQGLAPITLNPGETSDFVLNFSVPPEASTKEYPLTILFSSNIEQEIPNEATISQSKLYGVVGTNIVVLISHENILPNLLKVAEIKRPVLLDSLRALSFTPILVNHGVQATVASGSATVTNMFGQEVYAQAIYPDILLGNQQRSARAVLLEATSELAQPTSFSYDPFLLLGKYTITVDVIDSQGDVSNSYTQTAVALPYSIMIALFMIGGGWLLSRIWLSR